MRNYKLNALRKAMLKEQKGYLSDSISMLQDLNTIDEIKSDWRAKNHLTPWSSEKDWGSVKELKAYIIDRMKKARQKEIDRKTSHFETVLNSGVLIEAKISVSWTKSRTWGMNPKAEIKGSFETPEGRTEYFFFETRSVGGCGYDKLSTAVAEALNRVNPILRALYIKKNQDVKTKNHELIGYESGYGVLPRIEGGVGVSCYPSIFETVGYKFETTASGKMFDVFTILKK